MVAKVPSFAGGMMPLSSYLADGVRRVLANPQKWTALPQQVQSWLVLQQEFSTLPSPTGLLVETFFDRGDYVMVLHTFEGRKVNNALGFLLTRRLEKANLKPLNFSITDYALTIVSLEPVHSLGDLLTDDILEDELTDWIINSPMIKSSFRRIATIAGLTEQRQRGERRSMKQITFSTNLIYDVLMKYEPGHILLRIAREEVEKDLLDIARLREWLSDMAGQIEFKILPHASPLSIPAMMQLGNEKIRGKGEQQDHLEIDGFLLTHLPTPPEAGQTNICGHLHPKIKISVRRRTMSHPCFACSDSRIIMPSFGAYTGGLFTDHDAIQSELGVDKLYALTTPTGIYPMR